MGQKIYAYSIFDKKTGMFGSPFFKAHPAQATRDIQQAAKQADSHLGMYPEDFDMYCVGEFDAETGHFNTNLDFKPEFVCSIKSLVEVKNG